jgi:hypothetical protein
MFGLYDYWLAGLFAAFAALDLLVPARAFPQIRGWRLKGVACGILYWFVSTRARSCGTGSWASTPLST